MKLVIAVVALLVVLGGAAGALFFLKLPPFAKAAPPKVASAAPAPTVAVDPAPAEKPDPAPAGAPKPTPRTPASAAHLDPATAEKITRLASIYEQMQAEDASRVMAKLPDTLVEQIMTRMDEGKVAKLMGSFPPDRAARITRALAQ